MSVRCSLNDNKTKRGNETLPVGDTIATDDFLARLQLIGGERHTDLALVMVDLADDSISPTK